MRNVSTNLCVVLIFLFLSSDIFAYNNGSIEGRIEKLSKKINVYDQDPILLVTRGQLYIEIGDFDRAIVDFQHAYKVDPRHSNALYFLGVAFTTVGEYENSKAALYEYLKVNPRDLIGIEAYAQALVKLKAYLAAAKYYDQAISYTRTPSLGVFLERALALMQIEPLPINRLEKGLQVGLRKHGPTVSYFEVLVEANLNVENYKKALYWIDQIPKSISNNPSWMIKRAQIYEYQDEIILAIKQYKHLLHKIEGLPRKQQKVASMVDARRVSKKQIVRLKRQL